MIIKKLKYINNKFNYILIFTTRMAASNDYLIPAFPPPNFRESEVKPKVSFEQSDPFAFLKKFLSLFEELDYVLIENDMWVFNVSALIESTVEFQISIYTIPSGCLIEIRHMFGCRYTFSKVINILGKKFDVDFNHGFNSIPSEPLEFDKSKVCPETLAIIESLPKSDEVCLSFLNTNNTVVQIISGVIQAVYLIRKKYNFEIANRILIIAEYSIKLDDPELLAIITKAIVNIASISEIPIEWIHQAEPVVRLLLEHDYYYPHITRESQRALDLILART